MGTAAILDSRGVASASVRTAAILDCRSAGEGCRPSWILIRRRSAGRGRFVVIRARVLKFRCNPMFPDDQTIQQTKISTTISANVLGSRNRRFQFARRYSPDPRQVGIHQIPCPLSLTTNPFSRRNFCIASFENFLDDQYVLDS